jgi:nucleotide-binding universal stress UspA family protein
MIKIPPNFRSLLDKSPRNSPGTGLTHIQIIYVASTTVAPGSLNPASVHMRPDTENDDMRPKPLHLAITPAPNSEPPIPWQPTDVDHTAADTIIPAARRYGCALLAMGGFQSADSQQVFRSQIGKPRRPDLPKIWIPQAFPPIGARSPQAIRSWSARCHADRRNRNACQSRR